MHWQFLIKSELFDICNSLFFKYQLHNINSILVSWMLVQYSSFIKPNISLPKNSAYVHQFTCWVNKCFKQENKQNNKSVITIFKGLLK